MKDKIINALLNVASKMQSQRHLSSIKYAFADLMPIIIAGSFCTRYPFLHHALIFSLLQTRQMIIWWVFFVS